MQRIINRLPTVQTLLWIFLALFFVRFILIELGAASEYGKKSTINFLNP